MSALPGRLVLLGHPVSHSLSPRIQQAALRAAGIPLDYVAVDVLPGDLDGTLRALALDGAAGNVTIPHKEAVFRASRSVTSDAERVGAVNTFWHEAGDLVGDNTDVHGFHALAGKVLETIPAGVSVAVLGAGGAAAAVLVALSSWPSTTVRLYNRTPARARRLAARFAPGVEAVDALEEAVRDAAVVINATPIGLHGGEMPVPPDMLRRDAAVMDLAYRPGETPWVRAARAAGHPAGDGLEMLIAQGARAFERWFGRVPDVDAMRAAVAA